jgi:hypothetical protein
MKINNPIAYVNNLLVEMMQYDIFNAPSDSGWLGHLAISNFLVKLVRPKIYVELGVHNGNSLLAFCNASKQIGSETVCYGIDTWDGDDFTGAYDPIIFSQLKNLVDQNNFICHLVKSRFDDALHSFEEESIDILHIDGGHSYEEVKNDFNSWLPKVAKDGLILIHDISVKDNSFGVWRFWDEIKVEYLNIIEFDHSNGLGVVCKNNYLNNAEIEAIFIYFKKNSLMLKKYFERIGSYEKKNNQLISLAKEFMRLKNAKN